jgi:hypothetical protein
MIQRVPGRRMALWSTLALCLVLCGLVSAALTAQVVSAQPLLRDGFEAADSGWLTCQDTTVACSYEDGTYEMWTSREDSVWWSWAPMEVRTDRFVARVSVERQTASGGECGVVWGTSDANLYLLRVSPDGWYAVDLLSAGGWASVVGPTLSDAIDDEKGIRLQIVVDGTVFALTVNGETVGSYRLPRFLGRCSVGLAVAAANSQGFSVAYGEFEAQALETRLELAYYADFTYPSQDWMTGDFSETGMGYRGDGYAIWSSMSDQIRWVWPSMDEPVAGPFAVEATGSRTSGAGAFGICWGPSSDGEGDTFYWLRMDGSGRCSVEYFVDGSYRGQVLDAPVPGTAPSGLDPSRMRVSVTGRQAAIEINGYSVKSFTMDWGGSFWVGLCGGSWGADSGPGEALFTRFAVYEELD